MAAKAETDPERPTAIRLPWAGGHHWFCLASPDRPSELPSVDEMRRSFAAFRDRSPPVPILAQLGQLYGRLVVTDTWTRQDLEDTFHVGLAHGEGAGIKRTIPQLLAILRQLPLEQQLNLAQTILLAAMHGAERAAIAWNMPAQIISEGAA